MLSTAYSAATYGADGYEVAVECTARRGLPSFEIVGLPDAAIRESEKRIYTGSEESGYPIPSAEVSVNLAPADKKKEGTAIELAILVAIYSCCGFIGANTEDMSFIGEISFSGEIRPVRGALGMTLAAIQSGRCEIFVPAGNLREASVACREGIFIYGVDSIRSLVDHLNGTAPLEPAGANPYDSIGELVTSDDFAQIKGQYRAKRAEFHTGD